MFHIIDDWYIVPDTYCWMICRLAGSRIRRGKEENDWRDQTYYSSPEEALNAFARNYVREACAKAGGGELSDLMSVLSSEHEKLQKCIENAFAAVKKKGGITNG